MSIFSRRRAVVSFLPAALLAACADSAAPVDPEARSVPEVSGVPGLESPASATVDAPQAELSPELRAAVTMTLEQALTELELQPDAAMGALHEFLGDVAKP